MLAILIKLIHLVVCVGLIVIVLFQADKGEGLAGAFGGGASSTVFGERGSGGFMSKLTTTLAIIFMITSLVIAVNGAEWDRQAALEASRAPITATPAPIQQSAPVQQTAPVIPAAPVVPAAPVETAPVVPAAPAAAPVAPVAPVVEEKPAEAAAPVTTPAAPVVEEKPAEAAAPAAAPAEPVVEEKPAEVAAPAAEEKPAEAANN